MALTMALVALTSPVVDAFAFTTTTTTTTTSSSLSSSSAASSKHHHQSRPQHRLSSHHSRKESPQPLLLSSSPSSLSMSSMSSSSSTFTLPEGMIKQTTEQPPVGTQPTKPNLGDIVTVKYTCYGVDDEKPFAKSTKQKMVRSVVLCSVLL